MSIGYACICEGVYNMDFKSCTLKYATPERLQEIIKHNLEVLDRLFDYNAHNSIFMFRISSDIIPLASHESFTYPWKQHFKQELDALGEKAKGYGIRLSMHPGQYTVLNSTRADVVEKAIKDLAYHCDFLDALNLDATHKLILHIGGVYGDKQASMERFVANYNTLSKAIKDRLVIENDDISYCIQDVLKISNQAGIPVVFDNLHHELNPSNQQQTMKEWMLECQKTWKSKDGKMKVHYATQAINKRKGSHSEHIAIKEFLDYHQQLPIKDMDIMLEVKDKNLSAIPCILATQEHYQVNKLEEQWSLYKYSVMAHDIKAYHNIRNLLKDKTTNISIAFFELIEHAEMQTIGVGGAHNALEHMYGYFRKMLTASERNEFERKLDSYKNNKASLRSVKNILLKFSIKYHQTYLLDSYFLYND